MKNKTGLVIVTSVSIAHFLNDLLQSLLPAIYPLLKKNYELSFLEIGIITCIFQGIGSILQPAIGYYTDKHPVPYLLPFSFLFLLCAIVGLTHAPSYYFLLISTCILGIGSSIFHPEASRIARLASNGRYGAAQSFFQLGGNAGGALGPFIAALFISQQTDIAWLAPAAFIGLFLLIYTAKWYKNYLNHKSYQNTSIKKHSFNRRQITKTIALLISLMFIKYIYIASIQNYYSFYMIEKFHISVKQAQFMIFIYLFAIALGTILGGVFGDKIGARNVIIYTILGTIPFALALPFANLIGTAILIFIIGIILASAMPAIVVFAQELIPGKIGTINGALFGLAFGIGGASASLLGLIADHIGLEKLFLITAFLPMLGVIALLLPKFQEKTPS